MSLFGRKLSSSTNIAAQGSAPQAVTAFQPGCNLTLANAPIGKRVRVKEFLPGLSLNRRTHLQAYGLVTGVWVQVMQHAPVTVVQIEQTELAMETGLARYVCVESDPVA